MHSMIRWFAKNAVAANLLMVLIIGLGLYSVSEKIPLEIFPNVEQDVVTVRVSLPGASAEELESSVAVRIEENIHDLEGIKQIRTRLTEGSVALTVELLSGYDRRELMSDIKARVDAINDLPADVREPVVSLAARSRAVIGVVVSGNIPEKNLRMLGERVRDDLAAHPQISQISLDSVRPYEISIEVSESTLRRYNISLNDIANAISRYSLNQSAGTVFTRGGEVVLRTENQSYTKSEFDKIPLISSSTGTYLTLGELVQVKDGFDEEPITVRFNDMPSVLIEIHRIGDQSAIDIADHVKQYINELRSDLPDGVNVDYWRDRSRIVKARLSTLTQSMIMGGILVLILLALFLRPTVAFWVCMGIPISFLGGLAVIAALGGTINIISLFGFIMVLGIVVDDAIVTGESIYTHIGQHKNPVDSVIAGTEAVAVPVTFGVLTTMVAFVPMMLMEGQRAVLFAQISMVVIPVLLFSLIESKFILPAHLRHMTPVKPGSSNPFQHLQQRIANGFEKAIITFYKPVLSWVLTFRYISLSLFVSAFILIIATVMSGFTKFMFFPRIPSESVSATLTMPTGTDFNVTDQHIRHMVKQAQVLQNKYRDSESGQSVIINILSTTGSVGGDSSGQSHLGRVRFEIVSPEKRKIEVSSLQLMGEWRRLIGSIPAVDSLSFRAEIGRGGEPIDVQLIGQNIAELEEISVLVRERLSLFDGVYDIRDTQSDGKQERQIVLKPQAALLGLTLNSVVSQVRAAFFGIEVQRMQRGRDDVAVYVRYPQQQRQSLNRVEELLIRTPSGEQVPFADVAELEVSRGALAIYRVDRERVVNVTADANKQTTDLSAIKRDLEAYFMELKTQYPRVKFSLEGEAQEERDSMGSLMWGAFGVLFVIYCLLAIPFQSYLQPIIIMLIIPFGIAGAIIGHWLMGMSLTIFSVLGMLALAGVVVNDSLVLVDYVNKTRDKHDSLFKAVSAAGVRRFRPVILTSLTTFAGLMPLIFEKSTQSQFLIPMAVSLGFGIIFATLITLLLVPVNYLILEDIKRLFGVKTST